MPRFSAENLPKNAALLTDLIHIAAKYISSTGICTGGQIALAWLHAKGSFVIPIPGTTKINHFDSNLAASEVVLSREVSDVIVARLVPS